MCKYISFGLCTEIFKNDALMPVQTDLQVTIFSELAVDELNRSFRDRFWIVGLKPGHYL